MKKILAWILVFCMSLSMMPITAFAVTEGEDAPVAGEDATTMTELSETGEGDGGDVEVPSNELIFGEKMEFSGDYVEFFFTPETDGYYGVYIDALEDIFLEINSPDYDVYNYGTVLANSQKCVTAKLTAGITYTVSIHPNGVAGSVWIGEGVYVTSLEINQLPDRLTYVQGFISDGLDLTGLQLTITWSDGTTYEHYQSSNYSPIYLEGGSEIIAEVDEENGTVTVLCEDAAASYEVSLIDNPVAGFELTNADELPSLLENAYYIDYSGYQPHVIYRKALFRVTFTDGTTAIVGMDENVADYRISFSFMVE